MKRELPVINLNINLDKIDKGRIYQGKNGKYLGLELRPTDIGKYGDNYMAVESVTKEERQRKVRGNIVGNGRLAPFNKEVEVEGDNDNSGGSSSNNDDDDDGVPF